VRFLLRMWRRVPEPALKEILRSMVEGSLNGMACGGLYDHLGGGFFRCSTDVRWQIPQFEKTLYDNALLALAYGEAAQAFHEDTMYIDVMAETLKFLMARLQAPNGGFYSALHSVTDGSEGSFYTWRYDELRKRLSPEELDAFVGAFGVTEWGNFENGTNHLKLEDMEEGWAARSDASVYAAICQLRVHREKRQQPVCDDKLVAGWNGLAIHALAMGHRVLRKEGLGKQYLEAAQKAAARLCEMVVDGKLMRIRHGEGHGASEGMLEDYTFSIQGLLALYQEDFDLQWYHKAVELQGLQDELFTGLGKRYSLSPLHNSPLPPRQDFLDSELPSAQATAITNLLCLNALSLDTANPGPAAELLQHAEKLLLAVGDSVVKAPLSHASYLIALDQYMDSQTVVVMTDGPVQGDEGAISLIGSLGAKYFPQALVIACDVANKDTGPAMLRDKELSGGAGAVYVLGSEGNVEFNNAAADHAPEAHSALENPSEIQFE